MLDEFSSSAKVNDGAKTAAPAAAPAPAASVTEPAPTNDPLGPEFSKEMQAGLEDLLGDLGKSVRTWSTCLAVLRSPSNRATARHAGTV